MKKENGITLVALIVSIIVLLILATVSISLVINNGILDKAKSAVDKYSDGEIEEQIKLAYLECQTEKLSNSNVDEEIFIRDSLKEKLKDESLTVKLKNEKVTVNTSVKGENKTYIFKASSGEAYEYKDPFDYGNYTKENIPVGKDITLGTEKFRVFYNQDGVIKAVSFYNLVTVTKNGKIIQGPEISEISTEILSPFSTTVYWTQGDDEINMSNTRNSIQQYIDKYNITLKELGASEIETRIARYSEFNINGITNLIRNPGRKGKFWLGSSNPNFSDRVWLVESSGSIYNGWYSKRNTENGVRPIIIIEY